MTLEHGEAAPQPARQAVLERLGQLELENRELRARLREFEALVSRDTLTPLFNRRHFIEELEKTISRQRRYKNLHGLLFIDVDDLKLVNDTHGHLAGDQFLIGIANLLLENVRKSDTVGRLGGDEFGILLDNVGEEGVVAKEASLQSSFAKARLRIGGTLLRPSISIGACVIRAEDSPSAVIARADAAMYKSKRRS